MGLLPFGRHHIGFWMAERTAPPELPAGITPRVEGEPTAGGVTLVLTGSDPSQRPEWAILLHAAEGASLLLPWEERLFVALGRRALLVDEEGRVLARREFREELLSAWPAAGGLLLFGRGMAHLVDRDVRVLWSRPIKAEGFQPLALGEESFRIAAMRTDDWEEIVLNARTGAIEQRG
jgi:hypothetical protein